MNSTTDKRKVFFDGNVFYEVNGNGLKEIDFEIKNKRTDNFLLIIDDRCFFYELLDVEFSNRKKIHGIAKHYLMVNYPEEFLNDLKVLEYKNKTLVLIPSKKIYDILLGDLSNVKFFTTPLLELLFQRDEFIYDFNGIFLTCKDGNFHYTDKVNSESDIFNATTVVKNLDKTKIKIPIKENKSPYEYFKSFLPYFVIFFISVLLFIGGEVFRYKSVSKELAEYKKVLDSMYMKAGVKGKKDPYGFLLYKIKSVSNTDKIKISNIVLKLTEAAQNIIIDTLNYRAESLFLKGRVNDFTNLERFKLALEKSFVEKVYVTDTRKKDNEIIFSIRIAL